MLHIRLSMIWYTVTNSEMLSSSTYTSNNLTLIFLDHFYHYPKHTVAHKGHAANKNIAANILKFVQMYYKFLQIH